jgi:hypothetical protein
VMLLAISFYQASIGHTGSGGGGGSILDNGTMMARLRSTAVWLAILQQFAEPLQLFLSFSLDLKFVPLFSISVLLLLLFDEFGSVLLVLYAAAVCCMLLIVIVPVSAAVIAANTATIDRFFVVVVVWFILSNLTQPLLYLN